MSRNDADEIFVDESILAEEIIRLIDDPQRAGILAKHAYNTFMHSFESASIFSRLVGDVYTSSSTFV